MANPIATKNRIQSTVLANEYLFDYGFCRKSIDVDATPTTGDVDSTTVEIGTVLYSVSGDGVYTDLTNTIISGWSGTTPAAATFAVVIDPKAGVDPSLIGDSDEEPILCIIQGPCILKALAITWSDDDGSYGTNYDDVISAIDTNMTLVNVDDSQDLMTDFSDNS